MEPLPGMGRVRKKGRVRGIWSRMETQDPKEGAGPGAQTLARSQHVSCAKRAKTWAQ